MICCKPRYLNIIVDNMIWEGWKPWWGQSALNASNQRLATAVDGGDMRRGKDNVGNLDGASLLSSEAKLEVVSPLPFSEVSLTKDWILGLLCTPAWNCDLIDLGATLGRASRKRLLAVDGQVVRTLDQLAAPPYPANHLNWICVYSTLQLHVSTKDLQLFLDVLTGQVRALDVRKTRGH